jgi:integrase
VVAARLPRSVGFAKTTVQLLCEHRTRQEEERLTAGPHWTGSDQYVFTTGLGSPIHPDTVSSLMADLIKANNVIMRAGRTGELLPRARLHDLRHLHATTLLLAGVPVHVVAARLGHAAPSVTPRVYAHVNRDQAAEAADIFARSIPSGKKAGVSKSVSKKAVSKQPRTR